MTSLDSSTPEQHRARYLALKSQADARTIARPKAGATPPRPIDEAAVIHRETIPDGWYWSRRVARGESLRIVNPSGNATVSLIIWNADDTSERFNSGDTVKLQWHALLGKGDLLFSDMGRVLASITEDTSGAHDALVGGSTKATNLRRYGPGAWRNTRDNFLLAAAKLGLDRRDVMPCFSLFAPIRVTQSGGFVWQDGLVKPGDFIELRAEMNLLVVLSNCPHPLDPAPSYAPGSIEAVLWRAPPPGPDDLCRTASEEAIRGFENTDILFGEGAKS